MLTVIPSSPANAASAVVECLPISVDDREVVCLGLGHPPRLEAEDG
jgi:hypothetical protein